MKFNQRTACPSVAWVVLALVGQLSLAPTLEAKDPRDPYWIEAYEMREKLVRDKHRPRYHFLPPEGRWNDINGAVFHNGRYHIGYLQKITNPPRQGTFSSWQHISSRDLLHWRYHPASLDETLEGAHGDYFNSGDVIDGADVPTIITNMPRHGIVVYQSFDDDLDTWVPLPQNPVIPIAPGELGRQKRSAEYPETRIFDPSGWKDGDTYNILVGSKNYRPGFEGDSTSLFKTKDFKDWEYIGPFYQSDRKWTGEDEDCACSDFFPFGDKYMMVMHTHEPYRHSQYYIGSLVDDQFHPEIHDRISYPGANVAGPETLLDDQGRRIYWGWVRDADIVGEDPGWQSIMTLPWHFSPAADNTLRVDPVEELQSLRYDEMAHDDVVLSAGDDVVLEGFDSDCAEIKLTLSPRNASRFGFKLFCSPDGEEETVITYDRKQQQFVIDFEKSSLKEVVYDLGRAHPKLTRGTLKQIIPFTLPANESLELDIFIDRSIMEVFVNSRVCLVQRVYPTREDSTQIRLFAEDGNVNVSGLTKWEMDATNPW